MIKRVALALFVLLGFVVFSVIGRTFTTYPQAMTAPSYTPIAFDEQQAVAHLGKAVQFKTVSMQNPDDSHPDEFVRFHAYLAETFPKVHATLKRETVSDYSLLYTWTGADPALPPIILTAHMDVVPVEAGTEGVWKHPPFAGEVADGFIWGRGSIDDKSSALGMLEAAEALLNAGFQPKRTVYFAFGHDEELGGQHGATQLAALLKERKINAVCLLDEGSAALEGVLPGAQGPIGVVALGEKGYLSLELSVEGEGGHSSAPPAQTNIGILAAAVLKLEQHPMSARLEGPIRQMLEGAAPSMTFPLRMVMSNLWLFDGLVKWQMSANPRSAAALRTTTAATIFQAGEKDNVLPIKARAVVNFRILPGDTVDTVVAHVRDTVHDARVKVRPTQENGIAEPSRLADTKAPEYKALEETVWQCFPKMPVTPGLCLGATDARHYGAVAQNCYRFQPVILEPDTLKTIHNLDERLSTENYLRAVRFYAQLLRNWTT
jgi:carboxypeptidase PM20D1